jgi:cobalamin biosynthesis protein CobW
MHKIPVTVITGFLGAGKTTLIRHLLKNPQGRRIAVLVNEFGDVGIDGELLKDCQVCEVDGEEQAPILELTNGCLCCTVQEEFLPMMETLLQRRDGLDQIVIETSGLALPKPLVQAFRWPTIRQGATVDGVITVVDGYALVQGQLVGDLSAIAEQRLQDQSLEHETPLEELFEDQLACADLVLLSKTDLLSEPQLANVTDWLTAELRPGVKVITCPQGEVLPEILLGFNAAVEDHLGDRPSHHDQEEDHDHDDEIESFCWTTEAPLLPTQLMPQLQRLLQTQEIYRVKGFVQVPQKSMRLVVQGVGDRLDHFYDRPWQPTDLPLTRLVFIGRALDRDHIQASLMGLTALV